MKKFLVLFCLFFVFGCDITDYEYVSGKVMNKTFYKDEELVIKVNNTFGETEYWRFNKYRDKYFDSLPDGQSIYKLVYKMESYPIKTKYYTDKYEMCVFLRTHGIDIVPEKRQRD